MVDDETILRLEDLQTYFFTEAGIVRAVDGVSFEMKKGETMGLVGETGSGKTVATYSVMRIVPRPGKIVGGRVYFDGDEILRKSEDEMRKLRGKAMAMIFQDPNSSLNPVFSIEEQLTDIILTHNGGTTKDKAKDTVVKLLGKVGMPEPETRVRWYPHQFSGGMRQRIAIARALLLSPSLLFADEPTTNLDVTIQAQVLELLKSIRSETGASMVLITHDMGLVADLTERVTVLYAGRVAESTDTKTIFRKPLHPYTLALLRAVPRVDEKVELEPIPGNVPNLIYPPSGCRFHPRCKYASSICKEKVPPLQEVHEGHLTACHHWSEL
ncbi:MAG TPA: ABC transporter ATP-binding protein [Thermoproteota archaeon]|nr:ABC transporter ATP-binding protein [Thermoproteota archaeon]